jgi:hypothetical protein
MNNIAVVKAVVDGILLEDLESRLHLMATDVALRVRIAGRVPFCFEDLGTEAVIDYFEALGGIVTFWQVGFFEDGDQVLVLGNESFTTDGGLQGGTDFALVFSLRSGLITEVLVVEDLSTFLREGADQLELQRRFVAASGARSSRMPRWPPAALIPA